MTPPRPEWPEQEREEWLQVFSRTTLPAITVHEVAPGHFSHGLAMRHAPSLTRQVLASEAFVEGWAHYVEEVAVEEGFHADDPRFAAGVAIEALLRVTRLACAIGLHSGRDDGRRRHPAVRAGRLPGRAGRAVRGAARHLRPDVRPVHLGQAGDPRPARAGPGGARARSGFDLPRFHAAMLELGSPPLGLLDHALGGAPTPAWPAA